MINPKATKMIAALTFVLTAAMFTTGAAQAAGSHGGGHGLKSGSQPHAFEFGKAGKASDVSRTINIVMQENYFEPESIDVKAGETVRFRIVNKGELVHEFNLGTAAMHAGHQKEMMLMVEHGVLEPDKINQHMMKMDMGGGRTMVHNDPNSVLLEPGKTSEIVWKFSSTANLEFACNVPGHYDAGMMGALHIK